MLFEKGDYVFDIYKEQLESEEEKIRDKGLDDLEEMEKEDEKQERERATHIRELRAKWESIVNDIEQKLRKLVIYLDGRDSRVVLAAKLENKATLLYTLMDNYSQSTAERMMGMADYISSRLLLLDKIQKKADQEKGG